MEAAVYVIIAIFFVGVIFYFGMMTARVSSLEVWRNSVRNDLHEVSDTLLAIRMQVAHLVALADTRTKTKSKLDRS